MLSLKQVPFFFSLSLPRTILQGGDTDNKTKCHQLLFVLGKGWRGERKSMSQTAITWAQINRNRAEDQETCLDILSSPSLGNTLADTDWWSNSFTGFFSPWRTKIMHFPLCQIHKESRTPKWDLCSGEESQFLSHHGTSQQVNIDYIVGASSRYFWYHCLLPDMNFPLFSMGILESEEEVFPKDPWQRGIV